jgi:uncharacterized protein involved in exopolysaccharide biosynthesis
MDKETLLNIRDLLDNKDKELETEINQLKSNISTFPFERPDLIMLLKQTESKQEGLDEAINIIQIELNKVD